MVTGQKSAHEYYLRSRERLTEEDKEENRRRCIEYYMRHRKSSKPYKGTPKKG